MLCDEWILPHRKHFAGRITLETAKADSRTALVCPLSPSLISSPHTLSSSRRRDFIPCTQKNTPPPSNCAARFRQITVDRDGIVKDIAERAEDLWGADLSEIKGSHVAQLLDLQDGACPSACLSVDCHVCGVRLARVE